MTIKVHDDFWEIDPVLQMGLSILQFIVFPFNFATVWFLSWIELIGGVYRWYKARKIPWIQLGFPTLILSITTTSLASQIEATIQRLCIYVIPLFICMIVYCIGRKRSFKA